MVPIGTRFRLAYGGKDIHEVREPFTKSSKFVHYKNLATGDSGITIEKFCIRIKTPTKRILAINKTPIKRIK